jgi:hypothetical protein
LDVFYKITSSLTASVTLNTDFSETEVDEREINLTRFDLFFPEKRDFFLQDQDIFEFGGLERNGRPFFSRRIGIGEEGEKVDIIAGGKLTGRIGRMNVGFLVVRQDESDTRDEADLLVLRPSYHVLEESSLGMIVTSGNPTEKEDNQVLGFDFRYRNSKIFGEQVIIGDIWWQKSFREDIDHEDAAYGFLVSFPNEPIEWSAGFKEIQQNFRPALGFVNRRGIRQYEAKGRYRWRFKPGGFLRNIDTELGTEVVRRKKESDTETAEFSWKALRLDTQDGDRFEIGCKRQYEDLIEAFEIVDGVEVPAGSYYDNRVFLKIRASERRRLSGELEVEAGEFFDGDRAQINVIARLRPSSFLFFSTEYQFNDVNLDDGSFHTHLVRSRIRCQFSPDMTWSTLCQWDNQEEILGINSIFRWTLEPGRDLFFVATHAYSDEPFKEEATEVIGKLQWTFRY